MTSNTKLTQEQEFARKEMLLDLPAGSVMARTEGGHTILVVPRGNTVQVSTSICSEDENKWRRKVGEYHALNRWYNGESIPMPAHDFSIFGIATAMGDSIIRSDEGQYAVKEF